MKNYQVIFDGDSVIIETTNTEELRNELIELLDVNDILSYETLLYLDINTLMIITKIEMDCEVRTKEVL